MSETQPVLRRFVLAIGVLAIVFGASNALAADPPGVKGNVVVAKTSPVAILIWDASPAVAEIVSQKTPDALALRALTENGVAILEARAPSLSTKVVELRVVYNRSGDVSPVYGVATFAGVERLFVLKALRADILSRASAWKQAVRNGEPTPGLVVSTSGKLPPPQ